MRADRRAPAPGSGCIRMTARENRPTNEAASEAGELTPSVPHTPDIQTGQTVAAAYFRNCYAVLVRGKSIRRHLYFNLPAADRAVSRALARGDRADLVLVRLVPVDARHLDQTEAVE